MSFEGNRGKSVFVYQSLLLKTSWAIISSALIFLITMKKNPSNTAICIAAAAILLTACSGGGGYFQDDGPPSGFFANFSRNMCSACSSGLLNSQHTRPSANMFLHLSIDLLSRPESFRLSLHIDDMGTARTGLLMPSSLIASSVV